VIGHALVVEVHNLREAYADRLVILRQGVVGHRVSDNEKALTRHHRVRLLDLYRQAALRLPQILDVQDTAVIETHN
jgi:hypothetical protein